MAHAVDGLFQAVSNLVRIVAPGAAPCTAADYGCNPNVGAATNAVIKAAATASIIARTHVCEEHGADCPSVRDGKLIIETTLSAARLAKTLFLELSTEQRCAEHEGLAAWIDEELNSRLDEYDRVNAALQDALASYRAAPRAFSRTALQALMFQCIGQRAAAYELVAYMTAYDVVFPYTSRNTVDVCASLLEWALEAGERAEVAAAALAVLPAEGNYDLN